MAQRTDLYSILVAYSNKNNSPFIGIEAFLEFLGRYARKQSEEMPEWRKWIEDRTAKFWAEMSVLAEENRCELMVDTDDERVYLPCFYQDLLYDAYNKADEDADAPFPSDETLHITMPDNQAESLKCDSEFISWLEENHYTAGSANKSGKKPGPEPSPAAQGGLPDTLILRLFFPESFGSALVPADLLPRRLTETAIIKIRNYLRKQGNNEFALRKLSPQLQGREFFLRDQLNRILIRPLDCYNAIEEGAEFTYLFWAHLCILARNDVKKKKELLGDDIGVIQATYIIETINSYYKSLADKKRETEQAFRSLESQLARPPYLYTLDQILKFTNSKGVLLLSLYTREELEVWLRKKITESVDNKLPFLLIIQSSADARSFLLKDRIINLSIRLMGEGRAKVKDAVIKRWRGLLLAYENETAMENERDFEKLLSDYTGQISPPLKNLLEDPKLLLVYEEMEQSGRDGVKSILPSSRLFQKGQLLPYSELLMLRRKDLLEEAKYILPFWHSLPLISAFIIFFKKLTGKKKSPAPAVKPNTASVNGNMEAGDKTTGIRNAAEKLITLLVPPDYSVDLYLEELENRWSRLIDKKARENLVEDVKSLLRDRLRQYLKIHRQFRPTHEEIINLAESIISHNQSLSSLSGRDSLVHYSELYLLKLLETVK